MVEAGGAPLAEFLLVRKRLDPREAVGAVGLSDVLFPRSRDAGNPSTTDSQINRPGKPQARLYSSVLEHSRGEPIRFGLPTFGGKGFAFAKSENVGLQ